MQAQEQRVISFNNLHDSNLVLDAIYQGKASEKGKGSPQSHEPLHHFFGKGMRNTGGFRYLGSWDTAPYVVLFSNPYSSNHIDWPDKLNIRAGTLTYFGDQWKPGSELHNTPLKGNAILRKVFNQISEGNREIPPFLYFEKAGPKGRDVIFRGLAIPGVEGINSGEDLIAIWRSKDGNRFQNYRALFSILETNHIDRRWLDELKSGENKGNFSPQEWIDWLESGKRKVLKCEPVEEVRTKVQQLPNRAIDKKILETIYNYFPDPFDFEPFAARVWELTEPNAKVLENTRRSVDGGRDAMGHHKIGPDTDPIYVKWSLEAKRYSTNSSVGVREIARLISRLLHRQYGVLVTTSYVHPQAYKEIKEDKHPVVLITGKDIVDTLRNKCQIGSSKEALDWLKREFPKDL